MSTRANIHFASGGEVLANVYKHSDGYPDAMLPALEAFFADVASQTRDTRFSDPEYLAAKYVVWQAGQNAPDRAPLDFIGVGITNWDAGDAAYVYTVDCKSDGTPAVTWSEAA